MIKNKLCRKPTADSYIRLIANNLPDRYSRDEATIPISQRLKNDPELLEDEIWRIFEVETYIFDPGWDYSPHIHPKSYESWVMVLCKLADEGLLNRNQLVGGILTGLSMGFMNTTINGYVKFAKSLRPSKSEILAHQERFLQLLASQQSQVVTFALNNLKAICREAEFAVKEFIAAAPHTTYSPVKAHAKSTLLILTSIVRKHPNLMNKAASLAIEGLSNDAVEIQGQYLKALREWITPDDTDLIGIADG